MLPTDRIASRLQSSVIWSPGVPTGTQAYVAFRKNFDLEQKPSSAPLHLFADSRYLLWVNGRHILRGPCRFNPKRPEFDTLDIARHLQAGVNTIVVLVHHYPAINGRIMRHVPGLTAIVEADCRECLRTDSSWRCSAETEYRPSPGAWSSIPDVIDGRLRPGDWTAPGFDDSSWKSAEAVDGNAWGKMHARTIPLPVEIDLTGIQVKPDAKPLRELLPIRLKTELARPWTYPGGFSGKWMWAPTGAKCLWFKTVWSNAGFGVGKGCDLKIVCDYRFTIFLNGRKIADGEDVSAGWTGKLDVADGDVIAIEASDVENGDRPAGLFVSMLNGGNMVLGTADFRCSIIAPEREWRTNIDLTNFHGLSPTHNHSQPQTPPGETQSFVLDLGRMAMAYPTIEIDADEGSVLQLEYALRHVNGRPAETYGVGTTYTARAGRQTFTAADQWCARYLTVTCLAGRVKILGFTMRQRRYPFERVGGFHSGDPFLNRLWEMSVQTIECTSDDAYGSDARERNEWVQDAAKASFSTTRIATAGPGENGTKVYSDPRLLRNVLRHAALSQTADGCLLGTFPTDRGPEDPHYVIEDYNCQWVEALRTYHEATGDREFVREMWPHLVKQMEWFLMRVTPRGLLLAREYTSFDNPLAYLTCEGASLNAFFYRALRDCEVLARLVGETESEQTYARAADALHDAFNRVLWNNAGGTYHAGLLKGELLAPAVHAQLLALHYGLVPEERIDSARNWFLANYKNPGGFHCGSNPDTARMIADKAGIDMPVMFYWVFHELYRMNTPDADTEALDEMRRRWKFMVELQQDAGTLSERFVLPDGSGASESCHNYGAMPAYFLSSHVLGVRRDGPVWNRRLIIEPRPGDLDSGSGTVATEFGPVPVSWTNQQRAFRISCTVPDDITATLRLPNTGGRVTVDGHTMDKPVIDGRHVVVPLVSGAHEAMVEALPTAPANRTNQRSPAALLP